MKIIAALRKDIDIIDERIVALLNKRAAIAIQIGKQKHDNNFYDPEREQEILNMLIEQNTGPLHGKDLVDIYKKILSACLEIQRSRANGT